MSLLLALQSSNAGAGSASIVFGASGAGVAIAEAVGSASFTFAASATGATFGTGAGSATVVFGAAGVGEATAEAVGEASITFAASAVGQTVGGGEPVPQPAPVVPNAGGAWHYQPKPRKELRQRSIIRRGTGQAWFRFTAAAVGVAVQPPAPAFVDDAEDLLILALGV